MAAKNLDAIIADAKQLLRDEFNQTDLEDFPSEELTVIARKILVEVSMHSPYMVEEALTTTADSKDLTVSAITDLLEIERIEYRTHRTPREFRNWTEYKTGTVSLMINFNPSAGEDVHVYCRKLHTLTNTASTMKPQEEECLIAGTVARAAFDWINKVRPLVDAAVTSLGEMNTVTDKLTGLLETTGSDIANIRLNINKIAKGGWPPNDYANAAMREVQLAQGYLQQQGGYLRELQGNLSVARILREYTLWAQQQQAEYRRALKQITRKRSYEGLPQD
ncbi:MAG: hypothetical protein WC455_16280 [Dehalococcoidia bacterium]|jgi:hypothetical protein